ncbi:MAG: glycosyltransferase family 4 protein [Ruminococcaceae bacterium]|nr:glycosyltransferase family 4 protein [Oscillospiraceae bacterium]
MKHVVQVLTDTNIGGAGKYLLNYLQGFDRSAYRVSVILPENSALSAFVRTFEDVSLIEAPYMADCSFSKNAVSHLKKLLCKLQPDILHTHACLSARIAGKHAKVPVILATRHCIEPVPKGIKAAVHRVLNNALCDYYIAVSDAVVSNLKACGIQKHKIKVVNNGVSPLAPANAEAQKETRMQYGLDENAFVFGVFGRLEPVKGHRYFIEAASLLQEEYPNARFLIVGGGSLEQELKELAFKSGLGEKLIFTGFVPDTTALLNSCDCNVCASESEAMSLAILEAMSLAKPSIATNVGGNPELIEHRETGLLVPYADAFLMADAMKQLLASGDLAKSLGEKAKEKFDSMFTVRAMVTRLEQVYEEVTTHVN